MCLKKCRYLWEVIFIKKPKSFYVAGGYGHLLDITLFADIDGESLENKHFENILLLQSAITKYLKVKFDYKNLTRKVNPLKVALFGGFWYLVCLENNILKTFYLKNITNLQLCKESFEISYDINNILKNANSVWFGNEPNFLVRLMVKSEVAKYFLRKPLKTQHVVECLDDGSLIIEIQTNNKMQIKPIVYKYMPYIKLFEPEWLSKEIKEEIENYLQKF